MEKQLKFGSVQLASYWVYEDFDKGGRRVRVTNLSHQFMGLPDQNYSTNESMEAILFAGKD